ncbi:hypothetical protein [Streptococcus dysgalactiae]|uniref:hypothetical protein n=1 Tax=Streptococcus dysgalactiae TaxID=1334 RepID=UPI000D76D7E0|nr:hypothetical protein [Streptococcus dysgalactiae]PXX83141.1 hypothetical protein DI495_05375 [Streptococcus dysgalactiae subsp. equisimilis]QJD62887.1 hypothetical protein HHM65_02685 [Streptococcus dysgalactiae subsp. equisimilis]QJR38355.1 hypothetical protein HHM66_08115 [Streptococcus dysgalactiae subsp. equisimilis]
MNELERTALNEIMRTVTYIAEKLDKIEQTLEPQTVIKDEIIKALSQGKGIVDYGIGSKRGMIGGRALSNDERKALGLPANEYPTGQRGTP